MFNTMFSKRITGIKEWASEVIQHAVRTETDRATKERMYEELEILKDWITKRNFLDSSGTAPVTKVLLRRLEDIKKRLEGTTKQ